MDGVTCLALCPHRRSQASQRFSSFEIQLRKLWHRTRRLAMCFKKCLSGEWLQEMSPAPQHFRASKFLNTSVRSRRNRDTIRWNPLIGSNRVCLWSDPKRVCLWSDPNRVCSERGWNCLLGKGGMDAQIGGDAVSYTHLTLPTRRTV